MEKRDQKPLSVFGCFFQVLALPLNLVAGFLTGLLAPVGVIAGMLFGVRLLTGKTPFLVPSATGEAGRHLAFRLISSEDAKQLFEEQKDRLGLDLTKMRSEIEALAQKAKSQGKGGVRIEL
jgi:hypothetical protein